MPRELGADLVALDDATNRLVRTAESLSDADIARPSLLPGWTVGHVLTHVARNADGLVNLVDWALSGVPHPMYESAEARRAGIEQGAGRPAATLAADVHDSAERLHAAFGRLVATEYAYEHLVVVGPVRPGQEPDAPARTLPYRRLQEVEIHHVDLGLESFTPEDWPVDFVERTLLWVHARSGPVDVVGEPAAVLAWRIGRSDGTGVTRLDGGEAGTPPPW